MASSPAKFTKADAKRVFAAARETGWAAAMVTFNPDGSMSCTACMLEPKEPVAAEPDADDGDVNEWDSE